MFLLVLFLSHFRFMFSRIFHLAAGLRKKREGKKTERKTKIRKRRKRKKITLTSTLCIFHFSFS